MDSKYIEQVHGKEKQYLLLNENGKVNRVLKVIHDKETGTVKFFLFGGTEKDIHKNEVVMQTKDNFRTFFI